MRLWMTQWQRVVSLVLLLVVPTCFGVPGAWAQSADLGTLLGVITNEDGSVAISRAVVQLRNTVTGKVVKSGFSDDLGMYVTRSVPFGTYDVAVETEKGFYLTPDQLVVHETVPQVLSLAIGEDDVAAAALKSAAWWKTPVGIVVISVAVIATGLVVANQFDDDEETPESPVDP